jgi:putative acetyltransferase
VFELRAATSEDIAALGLTPRRETVFVASDGGSIIGHIVVSDANPVLQIMGLRVVAAHRRKGIGTALVKHIIGAAREQGYEYVALDVDSGNCPALHLYKRLGFGDRKYIGGFMLGLSRAVELADV